MIELSVSQAVIACLASAVFGGVATTYAVYRFFLSAFLSDPGAFLSGIQRAALQKRAKGTHVCPIPCPCEGRGYL